MTRILAALALGLLAGCASAPAPEKTSSAAPTPPASPRLGNFSVSLAVKDIAASRAFYEKLGFRVTGGNQAQRWLILQNESSTVGLFQGMFEKNSLTFNPGWDRSTHPLTDFDDVRDIQKLLKSRGITTFIMSADEGSSGPASFAVLDPDGNPILVDQHIAKPGSSAPTAAGAPE